MTDIREFCSSCGQMFSPLSSARGIEAEYCFECLDSQNTKTSIKRFPTWPVNNKCSKCHNTGWLDDSKPDDVIVRNIWTCDCIKGLEEDKRIKGKL